MNTGALLKTIIYVTASSLLYPVLFLLVVFLVLILVQTGGFFAEWIARGRRARLPAHGFPRRLAAGGGLDEVSHRVRAYLAELSTALSEGAGEAAVENLLEESTHAAWKDLDRLRILVRVAPGLGLIGTLIPMGTGLAALGQGDMSRLSGDLVIAFTTTVVGLATGMAAFVIFTLKRRWVEQDVRNMELATEVLFEQAARESAN